MPVAVEEMLRWVSPVKAMGRTVTRPVELGGRRLEAGDDVLLVYPSANRDEAVFEDPDRFDITRDPNEHLAFGIGSTSASAPRSARIELVCLFEALLERLPDLDLVDDDRAARPRAQLRDGLPIAAGRLRPPPVSARRLRTWRRRRDAISDSAWAGTDSRWHNLARGVHDLNQLRRAVDELGGRRAGGRRVGGVRAGGPGVFLRLGSPGPSAAAAGSSPRGRSSASSASPWPGPAVHRLRAAPTVEPGTEAAAALAAERRRRCRRQRRDRGGAGRPDRSSGGPRPRRRCTATSPPCAASPTSPTPRRADRR